MSVSDWKWGTGSLHELRELRFEAAEAESQLEIDRHALATTMATIEQAEIDFHGTRWVAMSPRDRARVILLVAEGDERYTSRLAVYQRAVGRHRTVRTQIAVMEDARREAERETRERLAAAVRALAKAMGYQATAEDPTDDDVADMLGGAAVAIGANTLLRDDLDTDAELVVTPTGEDLFRKILEGNGSQSP